MARSLPFPVWDWSSSCWSQLEPFHRAEWGWVSPTAAAVCPCTVHTASLTPCWEAVEDQGREMRANLGIHSYSSEEMELPFKEKRKTERGFYDKVWNEARKSMNVNSSNQSSLLCFSQPGPWEIMDGSAKVHSKMCPCESVFIFWHHKCEDNTGEASSERRLCVLANTQSEYNDLPIPKHNWQLELQLSWVPQSASFGPHWGHGPVEREQWKAGREVMVNSREVLTADECFQEAGMSWGCVYELWGLLWVRALCNVMWSHSILPRIGSKGLQWRMSEILV